MLPLTSPPWPEPPTTRRAWFARSGALLLGPWAAAAAGHAAAQPLNAVAGAGSGSAGAQADESKAPPLPAVGSALPLPPLELLDGRRFEPAQAEGRIMLVYWWASWCPFCALTSPHVDALWQAQRARGLMLLTLSIDRRPDDARAYLQRRSYAWPTAWVNPAVHQRLPKPRGLPVTLVRGRDGRVLQAEAGQLFPEDVQAMASHLG